MLDYSVAGRGRSRNLKTHIHDDKEQHLPAIAGGNIEPSLELIEATIKPAKRNSPFADGLLPAVVSAASASTPEIWWSRTGSNRRPPACKAGALPTELRPLIAPLRRDTTNRNADCGLKAMVGLGRFELPTSRLSGVRSNRLSYRPLKTPKPDQPSTKADLSGANFRDPAACHIQQRHALKASMRKGNEDGGTAIYIVDHSRQQKRCL